MGTDRNYDRTYDDTDGDDYPRENHFIPHGNDHDDGPTMKQYFPPHYNIPKRLQNIPHSIVNDVNDWHFSMLNDLQRNEAYKEALDKLIEKDDVVLEIGAGSGILSMLAAKAGAKHIFAIEASDDFTKIAKANVKRNSLDDRITLINGMSTGVTVKSKIKHSRKSCGTIPQRCTVWYLRY